MKILIATGIYPPEIGGPATYAKLLALNLPKLGVEVKVLPFREVKKWPKVLRHIAYFFKVIKYSSGAEIIFTQDPVSCGVPVICASFFTGKKTVLRVAGDYAWEQARGRHEVTDSIDDFQNKKYSFSVELLRKLQKFSVRHADVVITPSNYFSNLVSNWLKGKKKIITIYNGIDFSIDFKKSPKFEEKTIISAGRLVPWKGFDLLIGIIAKKNDWRLLLAGEGPEKERLVDLTAKLGVSDRVTFLGQLDRVELFENIYRSHVFALLTTFESFSFQIVEAMFLGIPVVTNDIGNLREIITNGEDGILIPRGDVDKATSYIEKILDDPDFSSRLSSNAMVRAQYFSFEKTLENLYKIFTSLK